MLIGWVFDHFIGCIIKNAYSPPLNTGMEHLSKNNRSKRFQYPIVTGVGNNLQLKTLFQMAFDAQSLIVKSIFASVYLASML